MKRILVLTLLLLSCGDGRLSPQGGTITGATANGGLVVTSGRLGLMITCAEGEVLKWDDLNSMWECGVSLITDGDKGDITTSSSGTVWTVDSGAVAYAELSGAFSTSNVIPKGNGSGLVASSWTDNGTTSATTTAIDGQNGIKARVAASYGSTAMYLGVTTSDQPKIGWQASDASERFRVEMQGINGASERLAFIKTIGGEAEVLSVEADGEVKVNVGLLTVTAGGTTPANWTTTGTGDLVSADDLVVTDDTSLSSDVFMNASSGSTTIYGSLNSGDTADDVFDHNGTTAMFGWSVNGATYIANNTINGEFGTNGSATFWVNYTGYNGGTTQFRDFGVADGKSAIVALFSGSDKTVDFNGDLAKFGSTDGRTYISTSSIDFEYTVNATSTGYINWRGYQAGTTQFRDLVLGDGKETAACTLTGSTKILNCVGGLTENGAAVLSGSISDNVIPKGSSGNLVASGNTDDGSTFTGTTPIWRIGTNGGDGVTAAGLNVGKDTASTTATHAGWAVTPYTDGNVYIDAKTGTNDYIQFRTGGGTEAGSTNEWLRVTNTAGIPIAASGTWTFVNNVTLGDNPGADSHTINGMVTHTNSTANWSYTMSSNLAGRTASSRDLHVGHGGSYATAGGAIISYAGVFENTASRVSGSNPLTNVGIYADALNGQSNIAIYTYRGDNQFNVGGGNSTFYNNVTAGDATTDSHTFRGNTVVYETIGTTFGAVGNTVGLVSLDDTAFAAGVGASLVLSGKYDTAGNYASGTAIKAMKTNGTDGNYSFDMAFATQANGGGLVEAMRIKDTGQMMVGDTATTSVVSNVDALTVGNTGTGQTTSDSSVIRINHSATYDTTSSDLGAHGLFIAQTASRSAGANSLINYGVRSQSSGGQTNTGFFAEAASASGTNARGGHFVASGAGTNIAVLANGTYSFFGEAGVLYNAGNAQLGDATTDTVYAPGYVGLGAAADPGVGLWVGNNGRTYGIYTLHNATGVASNRVGIQGDMQGSLDATAAPRIAYAVLGSNTVTRSAGANAVTNFGGYFTASGADANYGVYSSSTGYSFFGATGELFNAANVQLGDASTDRVGIGAAPDSNSVMTFANAVGNKISLAGNALPDNQYGFGVQANQFQYFTPTTSNYHSFGSGDSDAFTEAHRFDADGQVWHGDTANTAVSNNLDVFTIGNTGTSQTSSTDLVDASHSGSVDTSGGAITTVGIRSTVTTASNAVSGSNALTNIAGRFESTGSADVNYGIYAVASTPAGGACSQCEETGGPNVSYGIYAATTGTAGINYAGYFDGPTAIAGASGGLTVTGPGQIVVAVTPTVTATTVDTYGVKLQPTVTMSTAGGALAYYGLYSPALATRSSGANDVTNYGAYLTASGGQVNYALWTEAGSVNFEGSTVVDDTLNVTGAVDFDSTLNVDGASTVRKVYTAGSAPTLSSCGTSPSIVGNDHAGTVTTGTSNTGCTLTFSGAYSANAPICVAMTRSASIWFYTSSVSTSAITFTAASNSSTVFDYICVGRS